jgi:hypothetical protein
MNIIAKISAIPPLELITVAFLSLYILFPISTPEPMIWLINSSLGMVILLAVAVFLFFKTNILVGIVYLFALYELLRRSGSRAIISPGPTPSTFQRNADLVAMNPPVDRTLEEEVIATSAPTPAVLIGNETASFSGSDYVPVLGKTALTQVSI